MRDPGYAKTWWRGPAVLGALLAAVNGSLPVLVGLVVVWSLVRAGWWALVAHGRQEPLCGRLSGERVPSGHPRRFDTPHTPAGAVLDDLAAFSREATRRW